MRILIDGYYLNKPRGMGRYVQELLFSLDKFRDNRIEIIVLIPSNMESEFYDMYENLHFIKRKKYPFPLWEQLIVPLEAKKNHIDLLHSPYNTFPIILDKNIDIVVTIHDLMFFDKSHKVKGNYQRFGNLYRKLVVRRVSNHHNLITVSKGSQNEIKHLLNKQSDVIYTPVDLFYSNIQENNYAEKFGEFIFHIGGISPHKNTLAVIKAFKQLENNSTKLIISGLSSNSELAKNYSEERIIFTDWITDDELGSLYREARFVVFPSLREGYGLPIIESYKFNKTIITSKQEPMNEIAGDAALLVDAHSIQEIAVAMDQLLTNTVKRKDLEQLATRRGELISSQTMSEQILNIYRRISNE